LTSFPLADNRVPSSRRHNVEIEPCPWERIHTDYIETISYDTVRVISLFKSDPSLHITVVLRWQTVMWIHELSLVSV